MAQPVLIEIGNGHYSLLEDFCYTWTNHGVVNRVTIRSGFEFDGASIPSLISPLMGGRWGLGYVPPLIHDMLYRCGGCVKCSHKGNLHEVLHALPAGKRRSQEYLWSQVTGRWTRQEADRMFGRHMREYGVPKIRRRLAYYGVRAGGGSLWDHDCCTCGVEAKS